MIWLYRIVFLPALLALLPGILRRMLKRGGLREGLEQRFGGGPRLAGPPAGVRRIWIHAVSVGEILAIAPLVQRLGERTDIEIHLSTTTTTGYAVGRERYGASGIGVGYFPLDFWPFSVRAWKRIRPDLIVLTESELWPEHLHQARIRNVPVVLVNARLSDGSFARLTRIGWMARPLFQNIARVTAASAIDAGRFASLGFSSGVVENAGNLKVDVEVGPVLNAGELEALRRELGFDDRLVLMGSSTWPGEETALLRAFRVVRSAGLACQLLIVPRHAERRDEIVRELSGVEFSWHLRTRGAAPGLVDVCLADTTGEMVRLLQLAHLVFVGRSLPPHSGGQTPVEAAALGVPVLFGPNMNNFRAISAAMVERGAAHIVADEAQLAAGCVRLLGDAVGRTRMSAAARAWHRSSRGAIERTLAAIESTLGAHSGN